MKENSIKNEQSSIEKDIKIIEEKMNKELDFLIENANKTEQLTAISIIAMKEPIILLFLSILSDYKRVLKENEELKNDYENLSNSVVVKNHCIKNSIPVQKVKDKIEEYKNMLKTCNKAKDIDRIKAINERILELQELLEGGKEKTADELFDDLGLWLERETPFDFEVKNDDDKVIKFNKERREIACFNYYDGFEYLTLQELQAINKKCQELGWLKED